MSTTEWVVTLDGKSFRVEEKGGIFLIDDAVVDFSLHTGLGKTPKVRHGKKTANVFIDYIDDNQYEIWIGHHCLEVIVEDSRMKLFKQFANEGKAISGDVVIRAPMPGLVSKLEVREGDVVQPGTGLIILEAMKMENEIRSHVRGRVKKIEVGERLTVEKGQPMITIEPIQDK